MKKILFTAACGLAYFYGAAQSFSVTNYTANIVHPNPFQMVQAPATLNNISSSAKDVKVERTVNILAPGHTTYFCWGLCFTDSVSMSSTIITIGAGEDTNAFYTDLDPHGVTGMDTSCYKFFDFNNSGDFLEICFYFDVTTGMAPVGASQKNPLSIASPNPANTLSGINYYTDLTKNPRLVIHSLLGEKVFETNLVSRQGAYILNVEEFKQGIYIYSLVENGKTVATQKLVIAHQ